MGSRLGVFSRDGHPPAPPPLHSTPPAACPETDSDGTVLSSSSGSGNSTEKLSTPQHRALTQIADGNHVSSSPSHSFLEQRLVSPSDMCLHSTRLHIRFLACSPIRRKHKANSERRRPRPPPPQHTVCLLSIHARVSSGEPCLT